MHISKLMASLRPLKFRTKAPKQEQATVEDFAAVILEQFHLHHSADNIGLSGVLGGFGRGTL